MLYLGRTVGDSLSVFTMFIIFDKLLLYCTCNSSSLLTHNENVSPCHGHAMYLSTCSSFMCGIVRRLYGTSIIVSIVLEFILIVS